MKNVLAHRPALWFLFLFNLAVALAAPFVMDGSQGIATAVGMALVSAGAGLALLRQPVARA